MLQGKISGVINENPCICGDGQKIGINLYGNTSCNCDNTQEENLIPTNKTNLLDVVKNNPLTFMFVVVGLGFIVASKNK